MTTHNVDLAFASLATALRASTVRVEDGAGSGAGIVWTAGIVVTNAHVVRGARAIVTFADGRRAAADVVLRDDARDLAVVRVASGGTPATVRSSGDVRPGELAVAVGHPFGVKNALATGVVRNSNARWIVTDVRLAPGNSGGPLADAAGRIIGVNSLVAGAFAYAVPSDAVRAFLR